MNAPLQLTPAESSRLASLLADTQAYAVKHADTLRRERRAPNAESALRENAGFCADLVARLNGRTA